MLLVQAGREEDMGNVVRFPRSPSIVQAEAEALLVEQMRMNLATAMGALHDNPDKTDLCDVLDRITMVAELVTKLVDLRKICE